MTDHPGFVAQLQQTPMPEDGITDEHLAISGLNKDWNRLREALSWYTDAANCRRGVFGQLVRNGNRNRWEPDNGNMARAALSQGGSSDQSAKSYVERAIASYAGDPADNQFQKGFLAALKVVRDEAFLPKSAPAVRSSLPSGESDPSVTLDWAGADTAYDIDELVEGITDENRHEETPISMPGTSVQVERPWMPIETAPRDGTPILAVGGGLASEAAVISYNEVVGCWNAPNDMLDDRDDDAEGYNRPTHWQRIPAFIKGDGQ